MLMYKMTYPDSPDGEDCFQKIHYFGRTGLVAGLFVSSYEILLISKPKGYLPTIFRICQVSSPIVLGAITFPAVVCAAVSLRKKDDYLNYVIAGGSTGAVVGFAAKRPPLAFGLTLFGGFMGLLIKDSIIHDWNWFTPKRPEDPSVFYDRTIYKKTSKSIQES